MTNSKHDALPVVAWALDRTATNWTTDPVRDNLNTDKLHGLVWRDAAEAELAELRELCDVTSVALADKCKEFVAMGAELTTLRARLAEMEQQEPVAFGQWAQGLPKGTRLLRYDGEPMVSHEQSATFNVPLYAAPVHTPSQVAAEVELDAARYRWLRDDSRLIGDNLDGHASNFCVVTADGEDVMFLKELDRAIDRALLATSQESKNAQ